MPLQHTILPTDSLQVADKRKRGYFTVDNVLLDVYGAQLGPHGIAVYCALARFANADSECWPTLRTIAARTGVSRSQVIRELAKLEQLQIVAVTRRIDDKGERMPHLYTLLDIIECGSTEKPPPDSTEESPSARVKHRTKPKNNDPGPKDKQGKNYLPPEYRDIMLG